MPGNIISGFVKGAGDDIYLADVTFVSGASATPGVNNVLHVTVGSTTYNLNLNTSQDLSGVSFQVAQEGSGSDVTIICFMPGTLIRTPTGEVPVETLQRGDLVTVTDGRAMPVTWLGRQTVSTRFGDPLRVLPIRIKAGALARERSVPRPAGFA